MKGAYGFFDVPPSSPCGKCRTNPKVGGSYMYHVAIVRVRQIDLKNF